MNKSNIATAILGIGLDRDHPAPLQRQLTEGLRSLVHQGRLRPGHKLPPSRVLAEELGVSRVTITAALDQLAAEGYLIGRRGSGVFVADALPDPMGEPTQRLVTAAQSPGAVAANQPTCFEISAPDLNSFPFQEWTRAFDLAWRKPDPELLGRPDPKGLLALRVAIARHLADWRGIACTPDQIMITSGLTEAMEWVSAALLHRSDMIAIEEPGHAPLRNAILRMGHPCANLPVDDHGAEISLLDRTSKAVVVTPSRQFPLGMTLPLARRLALLEWSQSVNGYIVEDDFDGEYRYRGQPLPALMSLDKAGRVIYVGSFSKVLFAGLRLGFVVWPEALVDKAEKALERIGARAGLMAQPMLARFIDDGLFATHLRRMRRLYGHRRQVLIDALSHRAGALVDVQAYPSGMHLVAALKGKGGSDVVPDGLDQKIDQAARAQGITARAVSSYYLAGRPNRQGLVLGFAAFDHEAIVDGVDRLATIIRSAHQA